MNISPYKVSLFSASTGALSARLDHENGTFRHLHSLVDPEHEADFYTSLSLWGDRIIFVGCGLGYHLKRLMDSLQQHQELCIIEYYRELASVVTETVFKANKAVIITSEDTDPMEKLHTFLIGGSMVQIIRHPPSFTANRQFYQSLLTTPGILRSQPRKRNSMMLMQSGFFAECELAAAADVEGINCAHFNYKANLDTVAFESKFQELAQSTTPDFIISINMLGIDNEGIVTDYAQRHGIPIIVWFVDDPRPIMLNRKHLITKEMIALTWERSYVPGLSAKGFRIVRYLPLAADPKQFTIPTSRIRWNCGFVGSSMSASFLDEITRHCIWHSEYKTLADAIAEVIVCESAADIDAMITAGVRQLLHGAGIDEHTLTWLRSYCIHYASMLKRKRYIGTLLPQGIELFGDPDGWRELLGPAVSTHPDIDYRNEIAQCYSRIAVNVNVTSCQMQTAVNQRVFDVPLCGSFILTDNQADLRELFPENAVAVYASTGELGEKCSYFLQNEEERREISGRARSHILREHTYAHRLRTIISLC